MTLEGQVADRIGATFFFDLILPETQKHKVLMSRKSNLTYCESYATCEHIHLIETTELNKMNTHSILTVYGSQEQNF